MLVAALGGPLPALAVDLGGTAWYFGIGADPGTPRAPREPGR
jgi:hypothetical protein